MSSFDTSSTFVAVSLGRRSVRIVKVCVAPRPRRATPPTRGRPQITSLFSHFSGISNEPSMPVRLHFTRSLFFIIINPPPWTSAWGGPPFLHPSQDLSPSCRVCHLRFNTIDYLLPRPRLGAPHLPSPKVCPQVSPADGAMSNSMPSWGWFWGGSGCGSSTGGLSFMNRRLKEGPSPLQGVVCPPEGYTLKSCSLLE